MSAAAVPGRSTDWLDAAALAHRYRAVRARTAALCAPLSAEDALAQSMPDASPAKWHLAHTTWFFEAFVLARAEAEHAVFDPSFAFLFNSYYEAVGERVERARRGLLTRPALERVRAYREQVDARVLRALTEGALDDDALAVLELGLHHEQQHQELVLTDVKHLLGTQPFAPAYRADLRRESRAAAPLAWRSFEGGVRRIGAGEGRESGGFSFDNERPRHDVLLQPFRLATRPVTNREVLEFIAAGGYREPRLWLSDGWHTVRAEGWDAPLYWQHRDGGFATYDLTGLRAVDPDEPACHLSYYEADALARFFDSRLPTEAEWESVAAGASVASGHFADDDRLHPAASAEDGMSQLFGDVWEWTASAYAPYPGFRPLAGALGEYNGKFMCSQLVLRGGSCFTPRGHVRSSYRNFFPPSARWQVSGVRFARDG
jgi:ergothioneine biosynthesis protein EgtB